MSEADNLPKIDFFLVQVNLLIWLQNYPIRLPTLFFFAMHSEICLEFVRCLRNAVKDEQFSKENDIKSRWSRCWQTTTLRNNESASYGEADKSSSCFRGWGGQVGQTQPNMSRLLSFRKRLTKKFTTSMAEVRRTNQKRPKNWRKKTRRASKNAQFEWHLEIIRLSTYLPVWPPWTIPTTHPHSFNSQNHRQLNPLQL